MQSIYQYSSAHCKIVLGVFLFVCLFFVFDCFCCCCCCFFLVFLFTRNVK